MWACAKGHVEVVDELRETQQDGCECQQSPIYYERILRSE